MKFVAGFLLFSIVSSSQFYSASVDVANSTISSLTNYTFSLALTSSYPDIPAKFRIVMVFPSLITVPLPVNTVPNFCTVIDFTEVVITALYNSSNPTQGLNNPNFAGLCGVSGPNTVTLVTPYDIPVIITFKIGLIMNPKIAYNGNDLGNLMLYGYYDGASAYSFSSNYTFEDNTFTPSAINMKSFQQNNLNVGGWSTYTFNIVTGQTIPANGLLILSFTSDSSLQSASNTIVSGSINNGTVVNLGVSITGTTVTASGLFFSAVSPNTGLVVTISQVKNPKFVGYSSAKIYTATSNSEYIESGTVSIAAINPCMITLAGFLPLSKSVLTTTQIALYFSNDIYSASGTNQFYFKLVFPTAFTVQSNSNCINAGGLSTSPSLSCSISNNQYVSNLVTQIDQTVSLRFTNIINPPNNATTDYIQLYLYTSSNILICMNQALVNFTATPNALTITQKSRYSNYVADPGPYSLWFTTSTKIPATGKIKVVVPINQYQLVSQISCVVGNTTNNMCSVNFPPADPTTTELIMTEWCSATDTGCVNCCSAGTSLKITLQGIENPLYLDPTVASNLAIYTFNPSMTGVIDMITNGGQFLPSIVYRNLTGSLSRTGDIVQLDTAYTFVFVSSTFYTNGANIQIFFPTSTAFITNSAVLCTNFGNSANCSDTVNYDKSVNSVSVFVCQNGCVAGTSFAIEVFNVMNPYTTSPITGTFSITVYSSTFIIETVSFANTLQPLLTNKITNFSAVRSSDIVSSSISLQLSFEISSLIPAGGVISVSFPENFLIIDTSLSVFSLNSQLAYSGSTSLLSILNYCSTTCEANSTVSLIFKGVKNIDSVQTISGLLNVTSSYMNNAIDFNWVEVSTILAPILAGSLYNVDIHPISLTVSIATDYRIIFTTQHSIPSGATIVITFPLGVVLQSSSVCSPYLNIGSSLNCVISGNTLTVNNGFSTKLVGSYMIGILISNVMNPGSATLYAPFTIAVKDSKNYVIDSYFSGSVTYMPQALGCACSECSGSVCTACIVPSNYPFLLGYSCVNSCPSGYFLASTSPYTCIQCHYTCSECTSSLANSCTACATGLYMSNGACVALCPVGTVPLNSICSNIYPCTSPCSTCSTSTTFCLQCSAGYLIPGTGECVSTCPTGYYLSGSICSLCDPLCSSCVSQGSSCTGCFSYYSSQYLFNNSCVSSCPSNITVLSNGVCEPCDTTCKTCSALGTNGCESCSGTLYLYNNTCLAECPTGFYRFQGNTCVNTCQNGFYLTNGNKDCLACSNQCKTCATNTFCTSCGGSLYFYASSCVSICPFGYLRFSNNTCISKSQCLAGYYSTQTDCFQCSTECGTCSNNSTCDSCTSSYYLFNNSCLQVCPSGNYRFAGNLCVDTCIAGYYITSDNLDCVQCGPTCATCQNNFTCLTCISDLYYYSGNCLSLCPNGYLRSNANNSKSCILAQSCGAGFYSNGTDCLSCSSNCLTCSNQSSCNSCAGNFYYYNNNCLTVCPSGFFRSIFNTCINTCSTGFYLTSDSLDCFPCNSTCYLCSSQNVCTACNTSLYLYSNQCIPVCPAGYLRFSYNNSCIPSNSCGVGYFSNATDCLKCSSQCSTCSSLSSCNSCVQGYYLYNNQCGLSCPTGYLKFSDNTCKVLTSCGAGNYVSNTSCYACDTSCKTCNGGLASNCLSCTGSLYYYNFSCETACPAGYFKFVNNTCTSQCPSGYYVTNDLKSCMPCDPSCEVCNGPSSNNCTACSLQLPYLLPNSTCATKCDSNQYLYESICYNHCPNNTFSITLTSNYCTTACPSNYYSKNQSCLLCDFGCQNCISAGLCVTCKSGFYYTDNYQCVSTCPSGYISKGSNCVVKCNDSNCENCQIQSPQNCSQCASGYSLFQSKCIINCPTGTYNSGGLCQNCPSSCTSCSGFSECTSCKNSYYLQSGQCVSQCASGYYLTSGVCTECSSSCLTCSDLNTCLSCNSSTYLFNGQCVSVCPAKTILSNQVCQYTCPGNCTSCYQGDCLGCVTGVLFNSQCILQCPNGFYSSNQVCTSCGESCSQCSTGPSACTACQNSYLIEGKCYSACPNNTQLIGSVCSVICPQNCKSCSLESCNLCENGFFIKQGLCQQCPPATYSNNGACYNCSLGCLSCNSSQTCDVCETGYLYNNVCVNACPSGWIAKNNQCLINSSQSKAYAIYPLIAELIIISIIVALGGVIRSDSYLLIPSALALLSILEFSCKFALLITLWQVNTVASGLLVPLTAAFIFGTCAVAIIFIYLHLEPLEFSNNALGYYSIQHKTSYFFIKTVSAICGIQFLRIIYSGIFGFSATTEGKSLGISTSFRYPLEKLVHIVSLVVNIPFFLVCITTLCIYSIQSDPWQVAMFSMIQNLMTTGYFLISYYKSYWRS